MWDCVGRGIGLNASQTLCLITNIPLIFGDLVPEDVLHCNSGECLSKSVNISSPSTTCLYVFLANTGGYRQVADGEIFTD